MRILLSPDAPVAPAAPAPAPTPAPAPAPAPSSAPPTTGAPPSPPEDAIRSFDAQLEAAFDKDMGVKPGGEKPAAQPGGKGKGAAPAPAPASASVPAPAATPDTKIPTDPKGLRAALDRASLELNTKGKQIGDLEAKIKEYEAKGKDTTALTTRLEDLEKQLSLKDADLRALKHEASDEYKQKFEAPFNRAAALAKRDVEQLQLTDESGQARAATFEDFHAIYNQPKGKAMAMAKQLFGEDQAPLVISHILKLKDMEYEAQVALDEERANFKQREAAEQAKAVTTREQLSKAWDQVKKDLSETVDDYKVDPTDQELLKAQTEAFALFDSKSSNIEQQLIKNAHIRHSFAALRVAKLKMLRMNKQLEDMQAELATYKNYPPNPGRRPGGRESANPEGGESWEAGLHKAITT